MLFSICFSWLGRKTHLWTLGHFICYMYFWVHWARGGYRVESRGVWVEVSRQAAMGHAFSSISRRGSHRLWGLCTLAHSLCILREGLALLPGLLRHILGCNFPPLLLISLPSPPPVGPPPSPTLSAMMLGLVLLGYVYIRMKWEIP